MKLLHLIDSGGLYGAEKMLVSLAAEQQRQGATVVLGSIKKPGSAEKPVEREARLRGLCVKCFEMRPGPNVLGAWEIVTYANKNKIDLIHSHGYKTNILLGFMPRCIRRVPLVSTLHGWTSTGTLRKMWFNECLDALALRFVDGIVLVNRGMLHKPQVRSLPQEKVEIIDNGIDLSLESCDDLEMLEIERRVKNFLEKGQVVISIGRLSTEKGYRHLIEAIARLRTHHFENVRLLLIGDGRLRNELNDLASRLELDDDILITGYLENAYRWISDATIYAISSLTEGLPISLLEAMSSGTPIVATDVGGIPEVVRDGREALLVPPENSEYLCMAILKLLRTPELGQKLSQMALQRVKQHYSSGAMVQKYSRLYETVLSNC